MAVFRRCLAGALATLAVAMSATAQDTLAIEVLKAPPPVLLWERVVDVPVATRPAGEAHYWAGPLLHLRALGARGDGRALIVAGAASGEAVRLFGVRGDGRDAFSMPLPAPADVPKAALRHATLNGEGRDKTWALLTWRPAGEQDAGPIATQLIGIEGPEYRTTSRQLPRYIPPGRSEIDERQANVLRRLRDGSLLAGGTAYYGPPYWWFARFTVEGKLFHESKSRGFPDFVEDARGNEDGGYSLLMVDAERGGAPATLRRYGADGKLTTRRLFEDLPAYGYCSVLTGANTHLRYRPESERKPGDKSDTFARGRLVLVDAYGAIARRIGMGPNECTSLSRTGDGIVLVATRSEAGDTPPMIVAGFTPAGAQRWRLDVPSGIAKVEPLADGGVLVARPDVADGKPVVKLARYRAP